MKLYLLPKVPGGSDNVCERAQSESTESTESLKVLCKFPRLLIKDLSLNPVIGVSD